MPLGSLFGWATARDAATLRASNASERWVGGKTTGVTVLATFFADTSIKFFAVFGLVGSSGFHTAGFGSRHLNFLSAHHYYWYILPLYHTYGFLSICFFLKICFNNFIIPEHFFVTFCTNCGKKVLTLCAM